MYQTSEVLHDPETTAPQTSMKPTTAAKFCFLILVLKSINDRKL